MAGQVAPFAGHGLHAFIEALSFGLLGASPVVQCARHALAELVEAAADSLLENLLVLGRALGQLLDFQDQGGEEFDGRGPRRWAVRVAARHGLLEELGEGGVHLVEALLKLFDAAARVHAGFGALPFDLLAPELVGERLEVRLHLGLEGFLLSEQPPGR